MLTNKLIKKYILDNPVIYKKNFKNYLNPNNLKRNVNLK
jgi:hypothetical protein